MQTLTLLATFGAISLGWPLSTLGPVARSTVTDKLGTGCPEAITGKVIDLNELHASKHTGTSPKMIRIGIEHGQIPYLGLPAMTTLFKIEAQAARQFEPGRRVLFHIIKKDGWLHISDIAAHPQQLQNIQSSLSSA